MPRGLGGWGTLMVAAMLVLPACALAKAKAAPIYKNVSYGVSPLETATIYSQQNPGATAVVLVHGGGWRLQTTGVTEKGSQAKSLQRQGFVVFAVDYDQDSPSEPAFPLQTDEIAAATRWAIANAASYDANPDKVVLLGGSAGGQLAARAAEQLDEASPGTVDGVVSLSGPMDFQTLVALAEQRKIKDKSYVLSIEQALGCSGSWAACSPAYEAEWSPALNIPAGGCPDWLLLSSEVDTTASSQAEEMLGELHGAGCEATMTVVPKGHGFSYWHEVSSAIFSFIAAQ
jgi:acetyl esterase/lipase